MKDMKKTWVLLLETLARYALSKSRIPREGMKEI